MALLRQAYSALFRRTSTFALTIVLGAVLFERAFDQGADAIFEHLNEGVRNGMGRVPRREVRPGAGPGP
uniref:Complex III subunit 9 n=1 Tax=Accipiter nisus TaxID=211598 RepID=A0A8B9S026_9AVES